MFIRGQTLIRYLDFSELVCFGDLNLNLDLFFYFIFFVYSYMEEKEAVIQRPKYDIRL